MRLTNQQLADLARILGATADEEIDCGELLHRVAAHVRALCARSAPREAYQPIAQHLKVCPECREELVALLKAEGLDPAILLEE